MSPSEPEIRFFRLPRTVDRKTIDQFVRALRTRVARGRPFDCLVTTDAELQRLNRTFRRKDYPTDVLSFPVNSPANSKGPDRYLGDVAISWQRAREQAREFGHSVEAEIQVLMLHGVLHLLGLDHETDQGRMSRAETRWRRALGLPAGLIERVSP
jgi:probable rRNA maturation factor